VASVEVEAAIFELGGVAECAVVGVEHPILGQDVAAVVRVRDGAAPLELDVLRAALTDRLADYKIPRVLVVTESPLPRNAAGKVDKSAVAEMMPAS
jgi:acyl-coenzyme A synthetase/AMP-(fatty) acid ligase